MKNNDLAWSEGYGEYTYNSLSGEVSINIAVAISTIKVGSRHAPSARLRVSTGDIRGDTVTGEKPDADISRCPFHRVNTAAVFVERGTKAVSGTFNTAACSIAAHLTVLIALIDSATLNGAGRIEAAGFFSVE